MTPAKIVLASKAANTKAHPKGSEAASLRGKNPMYPGSLVPWEGIRFPTNQAKRDTPATTNTAGTFRKVNNPMPDNITAVSPAIMDAKAPAELAFLE
jgi:hypothetical protein